MKEGEEIKDIEELYNLKYPCTIDEMCLQTIILINCQTNEKVSELLIQACLRNNVDLLDINSDLNYIYSMKSKYHQQALAKNLFLLFSTNWETVNFF